MDIFKGHHSADHPHEPGLARVVNLKTVSMSFLGWVLVHPEFSEHGVQPPSPLRGLWGVARWVEWGICGQE